MVVGFDYWQVISHYPDYFSHLIEMHGIAGDTVHVISAIGKTRSGTIAEEVKQHVGLANFYLIDGIHEVVFQKSRQSPELKLAKCKKLGIEVFYDDRQDVCDLLNANDILAFKVPRSDKTTDIQGERN